VQLLLGADLAGKLKGDATLDHEALKAAGLARGGKDGVRLLGKGALSAKLSFRVAGASAGARKAVEAAGGAIELIELVPAAEKAKAKHRVAQKARAADKEAKKQG
jgi:large subunit ribosomal protein L15